jgi:hypothetical protein
MAFTFEVVLALCGALLVLSGALPPVGNQGSPASPDEGHGSHVAAHDVV